MRRSMNVTQQQLRAEQSEERARDLEHALNLLANEIVIWFASYADINNTVHKFGVGVAMNVPIEQNLVNLFRDSPADIEDRPIVFWSSQFENKHIFINAYSLEKFKELPQALDNEDEPDLERILQNVFSGG